MNRCIYNGFRAQQTLRELHRDRRIDGLEFDGCAPGCVRVWTRPGYAFSNANTQNAQHLMTITDKQTVAVALRSMTPCKCARCIVGKIINKRKSR